IGSPLALGNRVYLVNENSVVQCLDASSGKELWDKPRIGGECWGSLVSAGDRLYITNKAGDTFVLAAGPQYQLLAKNSLEEPVFSSMAVSDGELFIRTYKHLWCISQMK